MLFVLFVDGHVEDVGELLVREVPDPVSPVATVISVRRFFSSMIWLIFSSKVLAEMKR